MAILKDLIVQGSSRHIGSSYFGYMYGFLTGYVEGDISGNAATADKWKTPRSIKIGSTSHDLDGSDNVTWTLSEIGAQASGNYVTKEELNAKAYLQKAGGTMTGTLTLLANQYTDSDASGALNANNSDLYNVNSIKFADSSGGPSEGLQWKRSSGSNVDSIWVLNGEAYITPNRTFGSTGTNYKFLHEGNLEKHQFTDSAYGVLLSYAPPTKTSSQLRLKATNAVNRYYGVVATKNGYAYVNVPWGDTLPNQTNHYRPSNFAYEYNQFGKYDSTAASYAIIGMSYSFDSKRHIGVISYAYAPVSSVNTYVRSAYFKDEDTSYTLYLAYSNSATSNIGYVKTSIVKHDAANKFIGSLPIYTDTPTDDTYLIRQDIGGSLSFGRVKFSTLKPWLHTYIGTLSYVTKANLSAQGYVNAPMTTTSYGYAKLGDSNILTIGNKIYGVGITADGKLAVNVPWVGGGTGADGNDFVDDAEFTDDTNGNGKLLTLSVGTQNDVTANINVMSDSSYGVAKSYYGRLTEEILVNDATTITGKWVGTNITKDGKIVTNIGNVASGNGKIFYGTCASTASSTTKEVNCAEFTTDDLKDGTVIYVKFISTNSGSVSSLKLKVGDTSAYPIKKIYNGSWANLSSTADLQAGSIMEFTYTEASSSNSYWQILSSNTNTYVRRTYFTNQNTGLQLNISYGTSTSTTTYIRDLNGNRPIIPIASDSSYGVIKAKAVSSTTVAENINASNTSNRYGVVISGDGIAYVSVPWTDTHCDSSGHYSPSFVGQSASGTHDTNSDNKMHIVTGVTYTKDSNGHIGSISYSYAGLSLSYFVTSNTNPADSTTLVRVKTIITSQTVGDEPAALYIIV